MAERLKIEGHKAASLKTGLVLRAAERGDAEVQPEPASGADSVIEVGDIHRLNHDGGTPRSQTSFMVCRWIIR